jgi:hypothetical protein
VTVEKGSVKAKEKLDPGPPAAKDQVGRVGLTYTSLDDRGWGRLGEKGLTENFFASMMEL